MSNMISTLSLQRTVYFLLLVFFIVAVTYYAKPFLVPVCFAGLLAMFFLPLCRWFENRNIPKALSILICIVIFLVVLAAIIWLISWQITDIRAEAGDIEAKVKRMIKQVEKSIQTGFGISPKQQEKLIGDQAGNGTGMITGVGPVISGFVVDFILMLVYIFLLMFFRNRIKTFILQLISPAQKKNAEAIIADTQKVAQQYLTGLGLMIACLWVMYGIGFSIVGVKYALLFAVICGLLEIVPFIGNLTGNLLAVLMVIIQGGDAAMIFGVIITYLVVQFLQTYILEPLVVGAQVNINPLFTIIILVIGELIWGIPGMILAIPLLGIIKIICDHIPSLKPYGYLIGSDKKKKRSLIQRKKN